MSNMTIKVQLLSYIEKWTERMIVSVFPAFYETQHPRINHSVCRSPSSE